MGNDLAWALAMLSMAASWLGGFCICDGARHWAVPICLLAAAVLMAGALAVVPPLGYR